MLRTSFLLVPIACLATGTALLFLSGCGREQDKSEAEPPSHAPASYMKDTAFRQQLSDKRKELQAILSERAPLVARMEELVRSNHSNLAILQKIPEWNELHKKVVALNEKYEETRQRQLKIFRDRAVPPGAPVPAQPVTQGHSTSKDTKAISK